MRQSRQNALQKLKEARQNPSARMEQYQVQSESDMYLNEEEEQKRADEYQSHNFIVDDCGLGYDDHGELQYSDEEQLSEEDDAKQTKREESIKKFLKPVQTSMGRARTPQAPKPPTISEEKSLDVMNDYLSMLDSSDVNNADDVLNMGFTPSAPKSIRVEKGISVAESVLAARAKLANKYNQPPPEAKRPQVSSQPSQGLKRSAPDVAPPQPAAMPEPVVEEPVMDYTAMDVEVNDPGIEEPTTIEDQIQTLGLEDKAMPEAMQVDWEQIQSNRADIIERVEMPNAEKVVENLPFFYIDAYEDPQMEKGAVFLFGKALIEGQLVNCTLVVRNILRTLFVLPRATPSEEQPLSDIMGTVYGELNELRLKYGIKKWTCSSAKRNYCFEIDGIPLKETDYIKMQYNGIFPMINPTTSDNIAHIFGTQTTLLEHLIIKQKIKGPCWLMIQNAFDDTFRTRYSSGKYEYTVNEPKDIIINHEDLINKPMPSLSVMSLSFRTWRNLKNKNEIVAISGIVHNNIKMDGPTENRGYGYKPFTLIRKLNGRMPSDARTYFQNKGSIEAFYDEKSLIQKFIEKIGQYDPDMIIGHELCGSMMETLISRIFDLNVSNGSKLSRLRRTRLQRTKGMGGGEFFTYRVATSGRLLCDTFLTCKELVRESTYTLTKLTESILKSQRSDQSPDEIEFAFLNCPLMEKLCTVNEKDAWYTIELVMHLLVIPLTKTLTNIAGNLWYRSLQNQRAERNEYLLMHTFYSQKFILPDKQIKKEGERKRENAYLGGLVLEPKAGLYDKYVLILDFNSLYPSIIQEYNLCFKTVGRTRGDDSAEGVKPDKKTAMGTLPKIIKDIVDHRRQVKNAIKNEKNPQKLQQLDIKQLSLKLTANSMYGCLGFSGSRFYAKPIAALITKLGRETLESTVKTVTEEMRLDVIYGDTDSIMIATNQDDMAATLAIGDRVKASINKLYKCLEIEVDHVFRSILLYKKKKYAALKEENGKLTKEIKGMDMVRRDWAPIAKNLCADILDDILSGNPIDDIITAITTKLSDCYERLNTNQFQLSDYIITKQITKKLEKYNEQAKQPHVKVALKLKERGEVDSNLVHHFIPYVICIGEEASAADRAHHPSDVVSSQGALVIDKDYYINQQILPMVIRMCSQLQDIDGARIASLFGQDPAKYVQQEKVTTYGGFNSIEGKTYDVSIVKPLLLKCPKCRTEREIASLFNPVNVYSHFASPCCNVKYTQTYLQNRVTAYLKTVENDLLAKLSKKAKDSRDLYVMQNCNSYIRDLFSIDNFTRAMSKNPNQKLVNDVGLGEWEKELTGKISTMINEKIRRNDNQSIHFLGLVEPRDFSEVYDFELRAF